MVRTFARIFGILYVIVGLLGFLPPLAPHPAAGPHPSVELLHGNLLGLFPVNVLHNIVHLAIGLWGLASARSFGAARTYARSLAVLYGLLAVMGLIPATNMTFGLIPIFGNDVWLHAGSALIAAYFGFAASHEAEGQGGSGGDGAARTYSSRS